MSFVSKLAASLVMPTDRSCRLLGGAGWMGRVIGSGGSGVGAVQVGQCQSLKLFGYWCEGVNVVSAGAWVSAEVGARDDLARVRQWALRGSAGARMSPPGGWTRRACLVYGSR